MGLGDRGKNQVKKGSPSGLFARTEPGITEIQTSSNTQTQNPINTGIQEVDIVREALDDWLKKQGY